MEQLNRCTILARYLLASFVITIGLVTIIGSGGCGWGTAELIEADEGHAYSQVVAVDIAGNAIAVWDMIRILATLYCHPAYRPHGPGQAKRYPTPDRLCVLYSSPRSHSIAPGRRSDRVISARWCIVH